MLNEQGATAEEVKKCQTTRKCIWPCSNLDMICANNLKVAGAGFAGDTNVITIITNTPPGYSQPRRRL